MQIVTVKFQEKILQKIDKTIFNHNFNSRTEFIREAIRNKMRELDKEELIKQFLKFKGKAGKQTSEIHRYKVKEQVSKELMDELDR